SRPCRRARARHARTAWATYPAPARCTHRGARLWQIAARPLESQSPYHAPHRRRRDTAVLLRVIAILSRRRSGAFERRLGGCEEISKMGCDGTKDQDVAARRQSDFRIFFTRSPPAQPRCRGKVRTGAEPPLRGLSPGLLPLPAPRAPYALVLHAQVELL